MTNNISTLLVVILLVFSITTTNAQLNLSYVGNLTYSANLNDIWGYTDDNGNEYAIVGLTNGVSVVDISTPSNPVQVGFAPGAGSLWRDIKVWDKYAYITTDVGMDGLMIIDLSNLPNGITHTLYRPELTVPSGTDTLNRAHNIWIDENGVAYLSGSNVGNRGVLFFDVATTPGSPVFLGAEDNEYAHDCFARGDTLYTADIYGGYFSVYDISDKTNPIFLSSQTTPSLFTHNLWLSDNSQYLFTTDEKPDAYVGAYDVADPNNIIELDRYRPDSTLGQGVIPHNVHVWNDYLIVSYYTDGCIIVDAARPHNLIEVGNFDTYFPPSAGFQGAWGAYPYFPSGLIAVSDMGGGLFILQPNYVRACYLEGTVTDASNGAPIFNANIEIMGTLSNQTTDFSGDYATGYATAGTYTIRYSAAGYAEKIETVTLSNGVLTIKDVQLQPLQAFVLTGDVTEFGTGTGLDSVRIHIANNTFEYDTITDANGNFSLPNFYPGDYSIAVGKWGYQLEASPSQTIPLNSSGLNYTLLKGYVDDFTMDLGWRATGTATTGNWERAEPTGILANGMILATPDGDIDTDYGTECYVTGYGGADLGNNDVDNGEVILTSPVFDITTYNDPYVVYHYWFFNTGGSSAPNDALEIKLLSQGQETIIEKISQSVSGWRTSQIRISDYITPANDVQIVFTTSDLPSSGHIVEAAVDGFEVFDSTSVNTYSVVDDAFSWAVAPNPTQAQFVIAYQMNAPFQNLEFRIYNALGQLVETLSSNAIKGEIVTGDQLPTGVYFVQMIADGRQLGQIKVIKQ